MEYKNVLTTCPFCGVGCGLYLQTLDDKIIGVLPDKSHPVSQGSLCVKGWNAHDFIYHKDRLTTPLIRKKGKLVEASWDEALALVAGRLGEIKSQHGPDSIAFLSSAKATNEENYLHQKFARAVIGTNNVDHCARLCHSSTVAGLATAFGSGAMTNSFPNLEEANVALIIGSNTTEQHPIIGTHLMKMQQKGTKLIVADPRFTQIAQVADLYLRQKPGTDLAWINGMMHVIIRDGLANETFIKERTEGFEALKEKVADYTPERVEQISGIPADKLVEAAHLYAKADKAAIFFAMGITQHATGVQHVWQTANLAMLTGHIGKPGSGVNPLRGQNNVQGACDMGALPNVFPAYQAVNKPEVQEKFRQAWGADKLPEEVGLTLIEMIHGLESGKVKAMWVMGENPSLSDPDIKHVDASLKNAEFLVVQDIFLSETAQLAHVVLPAASYAEKDGTFTNTERRVQRVRKAIEPLPGCKPDWEIICLVAQKMGAKGFDFASAEEIMAEVNRVTPSYGGITYARLEELGSLLWPCPNAEHAGTLFLHKDKFARGLGLFHAIDHQPPNEEPDADYPFILTTGRIMFQYHTGTVTRRIAKLEREAPACKVEINPADAARLGLNGSKKVRVTSRRGELMAEAKVTDRVDPGVIFIPFHFVEAAANILTNPALDPIAKIPEYKVCAVKVEAA